MVNKAFKSLLEFKKVSNNIYNLRGRKWTADMVKKVMDFDARCQATIKSVGDIKDVVKRGYTFVDNQTGDKVVVVRVYVDMEGEIAFSALHYGSLMVYHWDDIVGGGKFFLIEDILKGNITK